MSKFKQIYNNIFFIISKKFFIAIFIIILTIFVSFADLLSVTMIFPVVQSILYDGENILFSKYFTFFDQYDSGQKIKIIISIFVLLLLLKNFLLLLKSFLTHNYEGKLINEFSLSISRKLIKSDYKDFSKLDNNRIFNLLNKEIKFSIRTVRAFFNFLSDFIFLIATIIFGIFFSKYVLATIFLIFLVIMPPIVFLLYKYSVVKSAERLKYSEMLAKKFRSLLDGLKIIKIFNLSNSFISNLNLALIKNLKVNRNFAFLTENLRSFFEILLAVSLFFILLIFLNNIETDKLIQSIPLFATLFIILYKVITSAIKAIRNGMYIVNLSSSTNRLIKTFDEIITKDNDLVSKNIIKDFEFKNQIDLRNISFSYDLENYIFKNLDLTINKSDKIFIGGPSGSGKTTLVELLCGLNSPTKGGIFVDEISIEQLEQTSWLNNIGYVGQKNILFNKSIKDNVFDGNIAASDQMYEKALKVSHTKEFLEDDNVTDNEVVTQNQDNFSGGQLKRISIARALIKNPKILILDEATNEFDKNLEYNIISDIIKEYVDITIIFISHNLKIREFCNRSLKIKNNNIYEENK